MIVKSLKKVRSENSVTHLKDSEAIRKAIIEIFSAKGPKYAVVGFVGYDAIDYLPKNVKDLTVICWPKVGATNPYGVKRLLKENTQIKVGFCEKLHQKLYYADNRLIVTSANLSDNALGDAGLIEYGVMVQFDIKKMAQILQKLKIDYDISDTRLTDLCAQYDAFSRLNKIQNPYDKKPSFVSQYEKGALSPIKIVTYSSLEDPPVAVMDEVERIRRGIRDFEEYNEVNKKYKEKELLLQFRTDEQENNVVSSEKDCFSWLFVDCIINSNMAFQFSDINWNENKKPFEIDSQFRREFKKLYNEITDKEDIYNNKTMKLKKTFLDELYSRLKKP